MLYSHRSTVLHTLAAALPDALNVSARDVILPVVPMFHVNAWGLPYVGAMVGCKMVFPGPHLDGKSLYELFEAEKVTCSAGVPTVWQGLLAHTEAHGLKFSTMNRTVIGGSACPPAMIKLFEQKYGVHVLHAWGMTEMSPLGTACTFKAKHAGMSPEEQFRVQTKQGRVLYGVDMKIVGDDGGDLPWDGTSFGDLLVRGPWVLREYFKGEGGNPLKTDAEGRAWFPTGDVATIDADGYMHITDRSKDVIKSGGEWISSIEIENIAVGPSGGRDGGLHRGPPSEVGRAPAAGRDEEARRRGHPRGTAGALRGQGRQVADSGRRRVRRRHPARRHRQDARRPSCASSSRTTGCRRPERRGPDAAVLAAVQRQGFTCPRRLVRTGRLKYPASLDCHSKRSKQDSTPSTSHKETPE